MSEGLALDLEAARPIAEKWHSPCRVTVYLWNLMTWDDILESLCVDLTVLQLAGCRLAALAGLSRR